MFRINGWRYAMWGISRRRTYHPLQTLPTSNALELQIKPPWRMTACCAVVHFLVLKYYTVFIIPFRQLPIYFRYRITFKFFFIFHKFSDKRVAYLAFKT